MIKVARKNNQKHHHRGLRCRREDGRFKRTQEFNEEATVHVGEFGLDRFVAPPQSNLIYYFIDLRTVQEPHTFNNNEESERREQSLRNN